MRCARQFLSRLANLIMRRRQDERLCTEIDEHIALQTEANIRAGMHPAEARRQAILEFGSAESIKEAYRDQASLPIIETTLADVKYGLRLLRKSPGFTAVAVLTLALGIGANSTIFSVFNAVLLRPLPYPDSSRLVSLGIQYSNAEEDSSVTIQQLNFVRENGARMFDGIAGYGSGGEGQLRFRDRMEWVNSAQITDEFFEVLGVKPALGRGVLAQEMLPGGSGSAVISDGLWRRQFGADPAIIGSPILLDDKQYTIVGVLPRDFQWFEQPADVFTSMKVGHTLTDESLNTGAIARLKPGVTLAQARAQMALLNSRLPNKESTTVGLAIMDYQRLLTGDVRPILMVLFGAVSLLLLITCVNVTSLVLARTGARRQEVAVRRAVGASNTRLVRQFLTESLVLALIGGGVGLLTSYWALRSFTSLIPWNMHLPLSSIRIDGTVLAFTLAVTVLTSILFGIAPFWQSSRMDVSETLTQSSRGGGVVKGQLRRALVTAEVALSLALVIGAALLAETLYHLLNEKLGFSPNNVMTMTTPYPLVSAKSVSTEVSMVKRVSTEGVWSFERGLLSRIEALPGVLSAAVVSVAPLHGWANIPAQVAGSNDAQHSFGGTEVRIASSRYFETMQIPVLAGRGIQDTDVDGTLPVIVINEALARRWFPNESPLNKLVVVGEFRGRQLFKRVVPRQVIGVVGDVKTRVVTQPAPPMVYIPAAQNEIMMNAATDWVIRKAPGVDIGAEVKAAVKAMDASQRVTDLRSMADLVANSMARQRFAALLIGAFAAVALILTSIGIYGVLSLYVNQRTHEIGVRLALGAAPQQVLRLVLRNGLMLSAGGVVIGIGAALGLSRFLKGMLYGVRPISLAPYVTGALLLGTVALLASYIPARRATKVDPMVALRRE